MPSTALLTWRDERSARLEELLEAHRSVGGEGAGRRTGTEQINWALVLRLGAEFQGFIRDLHTIGVDTYVSWMVGDRPEQASLLTNLLTRQLRINKGNANKDNLAEAFGIFGFDWWEALIARDKRTSDRRDLLEKLNEARNAVAHSNSAQVDALRADGFPLTLKTCQKWRGALNGLAVTMDGALAVHLGTLFSRARPW